MISFLWAEDENRLIGKDNQLPWRLPADLKYFKKTTMGHPIVMGRKTYESIGKPLPGRTNIVLTRNPAYMADGCEIFHSKEEFLLWAQLIEEEIFVIGGAEIYHLFIEEADQLYVTKIFEQFEGNEYFPKINWENWQLISKELGIKDEKNPYNYEFRRFIRKQ
ncbi:dihydrofolate reductase [Lederbergia galactosidilytica]|uniref:Dihydrofolate reductase n=1 Tax=Lederbergia galactosidilytica TaxID=217031 RepID=A0A178A7M6_9BACI|nr:dihydrofolate reductase [Lederbergia galactosidilytica]KRG12452.1 dihydrofolate reductase [Virgibacillus soli]OAK75799.1 dihydrofolate reductase [Lederbergia galactosidilytica]